MRITAIFVGLALIAPLAAAAAPARAATEEAVKTIIVYDGMVDAGSADRFLDLIAASHDQIIGLKVEVGRSIDRWTLDGFYLIESGGAHAAGALSSGAIPVDEAMVRLAPHVRIVTRSF